jgi:molecular chaperone DnaK
MSRTTIDFGIDLGTTNSAIAVLRGTVTDIIKNNLDNEITPSAVFIGKRGMYVGQSAKQQMENEQSADDVYTEFKRRMGTDHKYEFKTAGRVMRPEEISAEVLKSLRGDVQQRLGEDIQSTVITVPAIFEQKQCAATIKAGELAGFLQCPLLQEPVAAALAYGFQAEVVKEYWLVYDFGGGTFDTAIIKAEDGNIGVVNHGGDNYLGGSDIDWAIVDQLIIPELTANFNLPGFSRSNSKKWRTAFAVVKRAVEDAKIQLSRSETAYLEGCRFKDADGKDIEVDFKLTRKALIGVAEPIIMRSVDICKRVMKEKNLAPNAIAKVILVGGPTLAPYFRDILHANLGIQLDHSADPLTVVAKGAAIFAGTQRVVSSAAAKPKAGQFSVNLKYKNMGPDTDPEVRGEVSSADDAPLDGMTIEFVNRTPEAKELIGWRSGKTPLKAGGKFKVQLQAEKGVRNTYGIELLDSTGRSQTIIPDTVVYTVTGGAGVISEQPFCNDISVALANNEKEIFFKKGDAYPAEHKFRGFKTSHTLHKGESGAMLRIPVVEGSEEKADWNLKLGELVISGTQIRCDVPAGSDIEVTLHARGPGSLRAKAYIDIIDEEFEVVIDYNEKKLDVRQLRQQYDAEVKRLDSLSDKANETDDDNASGLLKHVPDMEELDTLLDVAKGDPDSAQKAEKRLLELRIQLDKVEDILKWPALVAEANTALDDLDTLIEQHGKGDHQERAEKLREQVDGLIEQKRTEPLRKKMEQVTDLHREILFAQPGFWVGLFNSLVDDLDKMKDPDAAARLINQGRQFISKGNVQGLRNVDFQLIALLPRDVAEAIQRGYQSGLLK